MPLVSVHRSGQVHNKAYAGLPVLICIPELLSGSWTSDNHRDVSAYRLVPDSFRYRADSQTGSAAVQVHWIVIVLPHSTAAFLRPVDILDISLACCFISAPAPCDCCGIIRRWTWFVINTYAWIRQRAFLLYSHTCGRAGAPTVGCTSFRTGRVMVLLSGFDRKITGKSCVLIKNRCASRTEFSSHRRLLFILMKKQNVNDLVASFTWSEFCYV